ncbi:MAG: alanine--tRNA ligase [Patescibacteria group bacterium]|nr:MAG: alanine--tRNA ligase [Patescibacteria group bacterium]
MTTNEIRSKFLDFFKEKGHAVIPSASLIPENDPTVLFTTAGMHPLVPYLLGEKHPAGSRLADVQKCVRTGDIDEVGDNRHLTFFEMLGNWSLGDYFKREAITWSFEFLTSPRWLNLDPGRIYVTVFEGDADAPRDLESVSIWQDAYQSRGIEARFNERIFAYPKEKNWWGPAGMTGPCGPDTEIFWDTGRTHDMRFGAECHPNCDCGRFIEIWNNVFMEYNKTPQATFEPLAQKNVDTGMGLERVVAVLQGKSTVFETENFETLLGTVGTIGGKKYGENEEHDRAMRIVVDHVRTAAFMIGDPRGITPSNVDQGYILRRLIRRAVRYGRQLGIEGFFTSKIAEKVIELFRDAYPELEKNRDRIIGELDAEEDKFMRTLQNGLREVEKVKKEFEASPFIPGETAFYLYESFGFPKELTEETVGKKVDESEWEKAMKAHQDLSRQGAEKKFKGGLADHSWETTRLHTATHLLHKALRNVLGEHVEQKGSNITAERLRFDFSHPAKMTPEEIKKTEEMVNEAIARDLPVHFQEMTVDEAKSGGAIGLFEDRYGDKVKVYVVGDYSKEICGGPHVRHTAQVGRFKIQKEEASSSGIRRIKAVVEPNAAPETEPAGPKE